MDKKIVTEEMHPEKEWFEQARNMCIADLPDFIERVIHGYIHDYGTACHAVAACAIAAAWGTCNEEEIGLSGFQAGFVMWDFIKNWTKTTNKCGLRLIDYDDMLYPQYAYKFEKTISKNAWECIQEEAKRLLENNGNSACDRVVEHWQSIANGNVPFGYRVEDER